MKMGLDKKKAGALVLGLALGMSGTTFAAETNTAAVTATADSFSDVPQGHWCYEALDFLAKDGVIEGYKDGTFQGNRTMTRYEMASIVAKALQADKGNMGDKAVLKDLQKEFQKDLKKMGRQVSQNTADIAAVKAEQERVKLYGFLRTSWDNDTDRNKGDIYDSEKTNSRFYLNLMGDLKINENWTGHLQSETNQRYAHSTTDGKLQREDGQIQRIWADGKFSNGLEVSVGRKWSFLGQQFSLLGATTDGIDASYPITKQGLRAGAYYYAMGEYSNADFSFFGPFVKGPVGHNFDVFLAYAKLNKGQGDALQTPYNTDYNHGNWIGSQAVVLSAATNVVRNLRLTTDYVRTNHQNDLAYTGNGADLRANNQSWIARLDYKWTNPSVVGSFAAYVRYHNIQRNGTIWNDDAWGSMLRDSKGWTIGFRYVPWKNVEWETFYEIADCNMHPYSTANSWDVLPYKRHLVRTQLDFHF